MADETNTQEAAPEQPQNGFQLERCYMKDASLEMPTAPQVFVTPLQQQPTVDMQFEAPRRASDAGSWPSNRASEWR